MKKLMTISAVIAAAAMMVVSCQQEIEQPAEEPAARGVLTASFAEQTKVTYAESGSNLQPSWEVGDVLIGTSDAVTIYQLSVKSVSATGIATLECEQTIPDGLSVLLYPGGADITKCQNGIVDLSYQSGTCDTNLSAWMIASGTVADGNCHFEFENSTAVIGISSLNGVPSGSTIAKINIEGEDLSRSFIDLTYESMNVSALTKTYDGVTTTGLSGVTVQDASGTLSSPVYLAVAGGGKIERVLVTTGTGDTYAYAPASPKTAAAGKYFYIKDQTFVETIPSPVPDNALSGEFSIGVERKIRFSKGNLQATVDASGVPTAWGFAEHQYDCLGEGGANETIGTAAGLVDIFGWSTASTKYGISTSTDTADYSGDFVDWGKNIGDGNTWFTLPTEEWRYLFSSDKYSNATREGLYAYGVTVAGVTNCVVLYPDGFDKSDVVSNGDTTSYDTENEWADAESAGAVCLPAAGVRYASKISNVGHSGHYWSSTPIGSDFACEVYFRSDYFDPNEGIFREFGHSVRLVTECQ